MRDGYGAPPRVGEGVTGTCGWSPPGMPAGPLRWGLRRAPPEQWATQALLATTWAAPPPQRLAWCGRRWQMAVTCEEARAHLGMEPPRQWSAQASARPPPGLVGLYACVSLVAARRLKEQGVPARRAAWAAKQRATCAATMALVRRWLWSQPHVPRSHAGSDVIKVPRAGFERLTETLC